MCQLFNRPPPFKANSYFTPFPPIGLPSLLACLTGLAGCWGEVLSAAETHGLGHVGGGSSEQASEGLPFLCEASLGRLVSRINKSRGDRPQERPT